MSAFRTWFSIGAATLLCGCASQEGFPSLTPRPIERALGDLPPAGRCAGAAAALPCTDAGAVAEPAPSLVADDPTLRIRVAELLAAARGGAAEFAGVLDDANGSAGRAGEAGSESWVTAQTDLSALEATRAPTLEALASIDALALERTRTVTSAADLAAIAAAGEEIQHMADAQQAELARLNGALNRS